MPAEITYTVDDGERLANETYGPNNIRTRQSGTAEKRSVEVRNGRNEKFFLDVHGFVLVGHATRVRDFLRRGGASAFQDPAAPPDAWPRQSIEARTLAFF